MIFELAVIFEAADAADAEQVREQLQAYADEVFLDPRDDATRLTVAFPVVV